MGFMYGRRRSAAFAPLLPLPPTSLLPLSPLALLVPPLPPTYPPDRVGSTLQFIALLSFLPALAVLAKRDGGCYQGCLNIDQGDDNWYDGPREDYASSGSAACYEDRCELPNWCVSLAAPRTRTGVCRWASRPWLARTRTACAA